jgi:porin
MKYLITALAWVLFSLPSQADWSANYTSDVASVLDGGIKRGTVYLDNFELSFSGETTDGEWSSTLLTTNSQTFSDSHVGDSQVASNIDNGQMIRLYELWYLQRYDQWHWQAGLIDLNGLYDTIDTAGLFLNSSHGIGPDFSQSGDNGPSIFPVTSLAISLHWQLTPQWDWQLGVFDAVPGDPDHPKRNTIHVSRHEGALLASEITHTSNTLRTTLGAWHYTEPVLDDSHQPLGRNNGQYVIVEHPNEEGLAWWLRTGSARSQLNSVDTYTGAGLTHPIAGGTAGISVAHANFSEDSGGSAETTWEATYAFSVNPVLSLQPSLQFVQQPKHSGINDATVFILRIGIDIEAWIKRK